MQTALNGILVTTLVAVGTFFAADTARAEEELFDLESIMKDPVDAKILTTEIKDGVVFQNIEYTTRVVDGSPERIQGILAFPEGAKSLPGVYWSMGGMAKANPEFPGRIASRGYVCLAVTLPHNIRNSFRTPFDAKNPKSANMTLLARDQLRGITMLSQRPEVDPNRIAVAGASYGGVFATLIAGVDPRVKAGFCFFGAGNHELGTSLPQFLKMEKLEDLAVWNSTFDPAFRLKQKNIPFMWGVAFNDHWFLFPAVAKTFMETAGTDKRAIIMPYWQHGFPPEVDNALISFLDTTPVAAKSRPAYNAPGQIQLRQENGKVVASFSWTGDNPVVKAELIVSYGEYTPWLGWPQRASFVFPAEIAGKQASAKLPIPSRQIPLIAWGTIADKDQIMVSTPPMVLSSKELLDFPVDANLELNCFIDGDLGESGQYFYKLSGEPFAGQPDKEVKQAGEQSVRVDAYVPEPKKTKNFSIKLFHNVPGLAHQLSVFLKAERLTQISVTLTPVRPKSWGSALVKQLIAKDPRLAPLIPRWSDNPEPISVTASVGTEWQEVKLDVPEPTAPVDGYKLDIKETAEGKTVYWIDTLRMKPVWPK
ncbi:MAG TPA: hypothetical protein DET40_06890 [Lentisphaeria bacterium]|nr:MAG: hypothetical protein A2X45_07410 [Lentisphaerae bacterium GWF2_50_93]HCE43256.1 hypothetical protein [Lentisphaeria bacterium]